MAQKHFPEPSPCKRRKSMFLDSKGVTQYVVGLLTEMLCFWTQKESPYMCRAYWPRCPMYQPICIHVDTYSPIIMIYRFHDLYQLPPKCVDIWDSISLFEGLKICWTLQSPIASNPNNSPIFFFQWPSKAPVNSPIQYWKLWIVLQQSLSPDPNLSQFNNPSLPYVCFIQSVISTCNIPLDSDNAVCF